MFRRVLGGAEPIMTQPETVSVRDSDSISIIESVSDKQLSAKAIETLLLHNSVVANNHRCLYEKLHMILLQIRNLVDEYDKIYDSIDDILSNKHPKVELQIIDDVREKLIKSIELGKSQFDLLSRERSQS
jgi:hypothetical protein